MAGAAAAAAAAAAQEAETRSPEAEEGRNSEDGTGVGGENWGFGGGQYGLCGTGEVVGSKAGSGSG